MKRRQFFKQTAATLALAGTAASAADDSRKAQIAITLDLEMSAQYPKPGMTEWNYQKGNLDDATKKYAVEAGRIAKVAGGKLHYFCVGRVLEQPSIEWLKELAEEGHPIGNHTYDHVNVLAKTAEATQFRFQRAPWLVGGQSADQVIRQNIRLTTAGLKERAKITVNGFRTPGGFSQGLSGREDVQKLLLEEEFSWISSKYPRHDAGSVGQQPGEKVLQAIVDAQVPAQPFRYSSGLIEIPMSPISDVNAFRSKKWKLDWFLEAIRRCVEWAIENGAVFDFLAHPSCLVVEDPNFKTIRMICDLVNGAKDRAEIVTLDQIASRMKDEQ